MNDFSKTFDNIVNKQHGSPSTSFIPKRRKFIQHNNNVYHNVLRKVTNNNGDMVCLTTFSGLNYKNKPEYEKLGKNNDTNIFFCKNENKNINHICIKVSYNINNVDHENITEIKLENNKISQIEEYNCVDEQIAGTITTINNQDDIAQKIKQIFGNKDDIGIQNILEELDEEQLNAITNNHEIDISSPSSNGCSLLNICNCNLDCLNCFSGIFNSKG